MERRAIIPVQPDGWQDAAACKVPARSDPKLFLEKSKSREAILYCRNCPSVDPCEEYGRINKLTGTYGGNWLREGAPKRHEAGRPPNNPTNE